MVRAYICIINKWLWSAILPILDLKIWKAGLQCICDNFVWYCVRLSNDESLALGFRILHHHVYTSKQTGLRYMCYKPKLRE